MTRALPARILQEWVINFQTSLQLIWEVASASLYHNSDAIYPSASDKKIFKSRHHQIIVSNKQQEN
jgi:hypothetical protein